MDKMAVAEAAEQGTLLSGRGTVLLISLCASLLLHASMGRAARASQPKPNIIFILADDLGYNDVGCYGQTQILTPNIDTLASQGMRFTQAYAGCTTCAPSRCSLMTGMHTGHCTIRGNFGISGDRVPLRDQDITVAEVLKQAGYATGVIGKWGLGEPGTTGIPNRQGFDYWYGYLNQALAQNYYPDYLWENQTQVWLNGNYYSHDLFTTKALNFITQNQAGPFFLYLAYTIPHAQIQVPSDAPYSSTSWPSVEKKFAAMVTRMDTDIGRIMTLLQQLGIDNNTIVFFTSDNGPHDEGGHSSLYFDSKGPLRGLKRDLYEGGIRVPMIARWPNQIAAGAVSQQVLAFWDFLPTAADLAGVAPPAGIDGVSMQNVLRSNPQQNHDYFFWESFEGFQQGAVTGDWKGIRKGLGKPIELYNLATDIGEANNVTGAYPLVVSEIREILDTRRTDSTEWPLPVGCGAGQVLNRVTLTSYAGVAPECAALTLAVAGQKVYTDRSYTLTAIPAAYQNAVLVQHANDDRAYTGSTFLVLSVANEVGLTATVAVAYQASATVLPSWLAGWTATGEVVTGSGFPAGDTHFNIYTKTFGAGATVTLGGNRAGGGNAASTYGVFVKTTLPPLIVLSHTHINRSVYLGGGVGNDTFTVANGGVGTLDYTVTDNADWLSVSPTIGTSSGEANPINVIYAVEGLPTGEHQAVITVAADGAANSPQTLAVRVTVHTVSPDFDGDADVDQDDFAHLQACLTGPGVTPTDPACGNACLDGDNDVDLGDFTVFQGCMSGANVPADPGCAG